MRQTTRMKSTDWVFQSAEAFGRQLRYLWHRRLCHSLVRSVFMASFGSSTKNKFETFRLDLRLFLL